jgi:hypothetical protein
VIVVLLAVAAIVLAVLSLTRYARPWLVPAAVICLAVAAVLLGEDVSLRVDD